MLLASSSARTVNPTFNGSVSEPTVRSHGIIYRCSEQNANYKCNGLLTKSGVEDIANLVNIEFSHTFQEDKAGYSIKVLDGWKAWNDTDKNSNFIDTILQPKDNRDVWLMLSLDKDLPGILTKKNLSFNSSDGKPNNEARQYYVDKIILDSAISKYLKENSVYELDNDIVAISYDFPHKIWRDDKVVWGVVRYEMWVVFHKNDAYLIGMQAPFDKWNDYRGAMYKMALTMTETRQLINQRKLEL